MKIFCSKILLRVFLSKKISLIPEIHFSLSKYFHARKMNKYNFPDITIQHKFFWISSICTKIILRKNLLLQNLLYENGNYGKVTPVYIFSFHLHYFHITASLFITGNVHCAWLALERFTEHLAKNNWTYPSTLMVVHHQRMYTANGVTMVMLGTDSLQMCLHGL